MEQIQSSEILSNNSKSNTDKKWYVMRDISRPRAKVTMYQKLSELKFEVFTPEHWVLKNIKGKAKRVKEVVFRSLFFAYGSIDELKPVVDKYACLQFRYQYGKAINDPMSIPNDDMTRFINAVKSSLDEPIYIPIDEITPDKCGKEVEIIGGNLNGYTGKLLKMRGTTVKRLIVVLPGFFAAGVEVEPEYIRFI